MPLQQRVPPAGEKRNVGGANVPPGWVAGVGEVQVLGTAAAAVVVDTDGGAAADGASLGLSRKGHERNHDSSEVSGEWSLG